MSIGTALVIDDEKNIRLTLTKRLQYMDVETEEAINGEEALQKLSESKYDIIFLDLKMQGMDGMEVLKIIKERDPEASVVIITAHGTVDAAVDAMKLGAADFMQKPFTPEEIKEITEEILSRKNIEQDQIDSYSGYLQFAKDLITRKDYDGAEENLKKAIGKDPSRAEPHNIMGAISEIRGNFEDAKKYYRAALGLDPGFLKAQRNLVRVSEKIKESN